jgi:altronate dehydratase small subunit
VSHAIVLHPADDVAVLVEPVAAVETIVLLGAAAGDLAARAALPLGHKVALRALAEGTRVRKYGEAIGRMTAAVEPGEHVHVHNLASLRAGAKPA